MNVYRTIVSSLLIASCACPAGHAAEDDSLKTYVLDELVISATRTEILRSSAASSMSTISANQIQHMAGTTVAEALESMPGVSFRSYGGSGALQSMSVRGMAAEHTLVLIDGLRLTSYQNGQTDLGIFSSATVDRIEVVKGGHSSLYGADALGGVVNIRMRPPTVGFHGAASAGRGSFGFRAEQLSVNAADSTLGGTLLFRREQGAGDFGFDFDDGRRVTRLARTNADYRLMTVDAGARWRPTETATAALRWTFTSAERGSPGPVFSTDPRGRARLTDRVHRVHAHTSWRPSSSVDATLHGSYLRSYQLYTDPDLLIADRPLSSEYINTVVSVAPEVRYISSPLFTALLGVELVRADLTSDAVNPAGRSQQSVTLSSQHVVPLSLWRPAEVVIYPSFRFDHFSDVGSAWSPRLGLNLGLRTEPLVRFRGSVGRSFRAPTFNDLYWREGGNPDLQPERSLSADLGAIVATGGLRVDVGVFGIRTTDRIVWVPGRGGIWSPVNVADVRSQGVEAEVSWSGFDGLFDLTVNSTWMSSIKKSADYPGDPTQGKELVYVPRQTVHAVLAIALKPVTISLKHAWASYRYTTEMNDRYLPRYGVTSAAATLEYPWEALTTRVKLEILNLFDTSYQVMAYYPMPPREIRCTVGVAL